MLKVDEIQNGVVIDHITAGTGLALYHMMELEKLNNASVALLQNVRSQKDGKKDIIKIEGDVSEMSFDVLAYVDPKISITFIRDGRVTEKKHPEPAASGWSTSSNARTRAASLPLRRAVTTSLP